MKNLIYIFAVSVFTFFGPILSAMEEETTPIMTPEELEEQTEILKIHVGASSQCGLLHGLEDSYSIHSLAHLKLSQESDTDIFVGVYDGHGGSKVSEYLKNNLGQFLVGNIVLQPDLVQVDDALYNSFETAHKAVHDIRRQGSTALVMLKLGKRIYIANAGDARAVVCTCSDNGKPIIFETRDHKPSDKDELKRIVFEQGFISDGRVGGIYGVSRSIGDYPKVAGMSATPDIYELDLTFPSKKFIILATDGIWDVIGSQVAANWVSNLFRLGYDVNTAAQYLVKKASERGSKDDLTAVIIRFTWN